MNQAATAKEFRRFQNILDRALSVGVESEVSSEELALHQLNENFRIDSGSNGVRIRHSGSSNEINLYDSLLLDPESAQVLRIVFKALPEEISINFQKLNIRHRVDKKVLGLAFAEFPPTSLSEQKPPFYTIDNYKTFDGYLNIDCLFLTDRWNPLFLKYHLSVVPSLSKNEYGYLRIDLERDSKRNIIVEISRVPESEVPETLKIAETMPR